MSNFLKIFKNIYEESFPLIKVKLQYRNRLPWLSDGQKASTKRKNKHYLTSLKHPTLYNILKYKQYKNKLTALLKCEEKHFYQSQIIKNKCNVRKVWIIFKQVINKTRSTRKSEQFMLNNEITVDPKVIADGFNNFFIYKHRIMNIGEIYTNMFFFKLKHICGEKQMGDRRLFWKCNCYEIVTHWLSIAAGGLWKTSLQVLSLLKL